MRNQYGLRAILVMVLLALGCRIGIAQIGPRYVLDLTGKAPAKGGNNKGQVYMLSKGVMLLRFQDLSLLMLNADVLDDESGVNWPAVDLAVATSSHGWMEGCGTLAKAAARRKLPLIVAEAEGAAPAAAPCYPMQTWDMLNLRKGKMRLRATAMAGAAGVPGVGGFMLDVGDNHLSYRVYLSAEQSLSDQEADALLERLPGADMLVWQDAETQKTVEHHFSSGVAPVALGDGPTTFVARRR